jgi:hypothetical protein
MTRLTAEKIAEFLRTHVTSQARVYVGRLPEVPNRAIAITMSSGGGIVMDGLFDTVTFTITCRGAENNFPDAELIAREVDDILMGLYPDAKTISFWLDDVYVDLISRTGGTPTQFPMADSSSRFTFSCNYYAIAATGIGQVSNG